MTINELIERGALVINSNVETLTSKSRKQSYVLCRHAIACIACQYGYKYREIAAALRRKTHGTICNSRKKDIDLMRYNRNYRTIYNIIEHGYAENC